MRIEKSARLILEDGSIFHGFPEGARGDAGGEVVFNTALTGYQEILTDPSYRGQIVVMTYPLMGNYGITAEDGESARPWIQGFVVREFARRPSNFRAVRSLTDELVDRGIVAVSGVDTRAITRRVRQHGALRGFLTSEALPDAALRERLAAVPELVGVDLVRDVGTQTVREWTAGFDPAFAPTVPSERLADPGPRVAVIDYGVKRNILRALVSSGFRVTLHPATSTAEEILSHRPDGVLLSNGPGDPRILGYAVETVRGLLGKVPILGICLGHQLLAAAVGANLYKMKFGHHGANHPVQHLASGRVAVTSQNHGFAVAREGLEDLGVRVTHVNLNDGSVQGIELPDLAASSVQFHPEAAPGPRESLGIFREFRERIAAQRGVA